MIDDTRSLVGSLLILLTLFTVGFPLMAEEVGAQEQREAVGQAQALSRAFEGVAKAVTPSLVNIRSTSKPAQRQGRSRALPQLPPNLPEPFRDFFERFGEALPFEDHQMPSQGLGSGVIVDREGHILTNNHVVAKADEIKVRLSDGRSFDGKIVGTDPRTDLAVVKINAKGITPAKLGDSDALKIGEWVVAAGTPFGLEHTITAGIVSAKGRSLMGGNAYEDFIQTDAAINPGNSGGPLANLDGEVVGINTAIFSRTGGYMGIGFAIPINMAKNIMASLIREGKVVRGWLGVVIQELTDELSESFGYEGSGGALVSEVAENGPAAEAGLQQGDIIVGFDDHSIDSVNHLRNLVAAERPGSKVELTLLRQGAKKRLTVKLGELPKSFDTLPQIEEEEAEATSEIGVRVETLTNEMRTQLRTKARQGVVITTLEPESVAARSGLRLGDIIKAVGPENVTSSDQFAELIEEADLTKGIRLLVESEGIDRFVILKE